MIKPWTWEESNGSAAYWQMKAATEVLSNCGTTAGFFHPVWNDLVDKVNETAKAMRHGWCNAPMKVDELKIAEAYRPLTAKMFIQYALPGLELAGNARQDRISRS